jgi:ABC-type glycerol-3-phosphate transport system permease component
MTIRAGVQRQRQWNLIIPRLIGRFSLYMLLVVFAFIFLFPFYSMFMGSFMQDSDLFSRSPNLWPKRGLDPSSYRQLMTELNFGRPLLNSFIISTVRTIGTLFFSSLAGFAFAKRQFPGRDKLFFVMLATWMIPTQSTLIPWYLLMVQKLGWGNTFLPFWIPVWASAFGIFLMRQFIAASIPDEMLEAATIDGASLSSIFARIVLPVVTPGLSVLAILTFVNSFNEFLGPLLILSDPKKITAPLALANFRATQITAPRYSLMFAGSTLATLPLLIVFFSFQRQLISGIMSGAIKGAG